MALTGTSNWASAVLINYVTDEIRTLEPNLVFAEFGERKDVPAGYRTLTFPQTNQLITSAASSITEGVNPVAYQWNATAYTATETQFGMVVQITDILQRDSFINTIDKCTEQIRFALSRRLDNFLQSTVNGSSNGVLYAGGKTSRASLGSGDLFDISLYTRGIRDLRNVNNNGLKPFANGAYAVIMSPLVETDFMNNTNAGGWGDFARYSSPEDLKAGRLGHFRGGMVYTSPNVQTFSSSQTVHPVTFIGRQSFGWGFYQQITPYLVNTADSNNPLNVYTSVGGKFAAAVTRFEDTSTSYRIVRAECVASA